MAADTPPLCVSSVSTNSELENDRELRLKKATFHTRNPIWEAGITIGKRLLAVTHTTAWFLDYLRGKCRVRIYPARSGFIQHEADLSSTKRIYPARAASLQNALKRGGSTVYILVVDDDQFANALVQFALSKEGFDVETLDNPRGAMQMIQKREPDLLILDVTMPYIDGFEFSSRLRAEGYDTPLIFMTAKDTIEDKLQGFNNGADDYICKPFNHQELVARVQAVMRRIKKNGKLGNASIRGGQFELFPADLKVAAPGRPTIILTPKEMQVLRMLMAYPGQVVKRDQLLSEVWNDNESNSNIVDVYIRRLRTKLEVDAEKPQHIISVRGLGYKFLAK